ncbi:MAG: AMP-binding protein, partial [Firmicutes bacterium]|nr:AMP-binding protein [Bacillota bacterium]
MKISFSTLACPHMSWQEICCMAKDFGYDGIEIRGVGEQITFGNETPFSAREIDNTLAYIRSMGLEIPCLSSGANLKDPDKFEENAEEIIAYCQMAQKVGARYVRVLADLAPEPQGEVDDDFIMGVLMRLSHEAEKYNVILLAETNGVYSDSARLRKILDMVNSPYVAALWDIHHTVRFGHEDPATTWANLGDYIKHVHIKDSVVAADGSIEYRIPGAGDLPLEDALNILKDNNFKGSVSLEWIKRWAENLAEAGIVVPAFIEYVKPYHRKHKYDLQTDERGTGQYVWPKNLLINYTFPDLLDRICEEFPDQYAFRYTEMDYTRTYPEFREDVDRFARALIAMGVHKGDHVAIWATNVPQWYITFWAATKIGAVLVTVNTAYKIHEIEYLLRQSDTHTLVMIDGFKDSNYVQIMQELCPELASCEKGQLFSKRLPVLKNIISCESEVPGCYTWEEANALSELVPYSEVEKFRSTITKDDVCNMQYTSGTTGFPKGV